MRLLLAAIAAVAAVLSLSIAVDAQIGLPHAELEDAPLMRLSGDVDSNSPAIWDRVFGRSTLFVMTSFGGRPSTSSGRNFAQLSRPSEALVDPWPGGGVWMEATLKDDDGTWYGYYHNENVATMCQGTDKVMPRIGAARSDDRGATWEPLGVILEAPPRTYDCTTHNHYLSAVSAISASSSAQPRRTSTSFTRSTFGKRRPRAWVSPGWRGPIAMIRAARS